MPLIMILQAFSVLSVILWLYLIFVLRRLPEISIEKNISQSFDLILVGFLTFFVAEVHEFLMEFDLIALLMKDFHAYVVTPEILHHTFVTISLTFFILGGLKFAISLKGVNR